MEELPVGNSGPDTDPENQTEDNDQDNERHPLSVRLRELLGLINTMGQTWNQTQETTTQELKAEINRIRELIESQNQAPQLPQSQNQAPENLQPENNPPRTENPKSRKRTIRLF